MDAAEKFESVMSRVKDLSTFYSRVNDAMDSTLVEKAAINGQSILEEFMKNCEYAEDEEEFLINLFAIEVFCDETFRRAMTGVTIFNNSIEKMATTNSEDWLKRGEELYYDEIISDDNADE